MLIPHQALILVADGRKYLLIRNAGDSSHPDLVVEAHREQELHSNQELGTDQPSSSFASSGGGRRASIAMTDFHQLEEDKFASATADILLKKAHAGEFDKLIVVAPPRTLAELRRHYDRSLTECILAEIDKDLTKHPLAEIQEILAG